MSATKIYGPVESVETRKVVAVGNVCGVRMIHAHTKVGDENKKAFLSISPFGMYPVLDVTKGAVVGSTAVAVYLAQQHLSVKLLSGDSFQEAQCISAMETCKSGMANDPEAYLAYLDVYLTNKSYLVGERLSVADVTTAVAVSSLEDKFPIPDNVARWCRTVMADTRVAKALKTQAATSTPKKSSPSKPTAPVVAQAVPVPPKMAEVEIKDLPATSFVIDQWKRDYSNSKDLKGEALPAMFAAVEGFTFWKVSYDKMEGECVKDFQTSNLLGGFIQSMPTDARKYGFGVFDVTLGEGTDYNYEGVLMLRGEDMPQFMFEHRSFEYHHWEKLDINNESDKQYIIECFVGDADDKLCGRTIVDAKQFK